MESVRILNELLMLCLAVSEKSNKISSPLEMIV